MISSEIPEGLTFDDVLLVPAASDILPKDTDTSTRLTRQIRLSIPLVSAAMDTVTEARTAIAMAQEGGIGIVHRNLRISAQADEVTRVKKSESGMISDPVTVKPDQPIHEALEMMRRYDISGLPVTTDGGQLVGILTNRDLRFEKRLDRTVSEIMTKENLVTARPGVTLDEAKEILHEHRIEKLLVTDNDRLIGLITVKDIQKTIQFPNASKDGDGRLRVGGAIGTGPDTEERVEALIRAGIDVLAIDTAHGHSKSVLDTIAAVKGTYPDIPLLAGNVATEDGALALAKAGVDGIKVGMGGGSICTTRVISGVGVPQLSAVLDAVRIANRYEIPVVADGGIKFSGDITKALAAGAQSVMIGGLFAGTEESPGETILYQGRTYKVYRGMGSLEAMRNREGSRNRYFQDDEDPLKLVPEGIEGRVPYQGRLTFIVAQLVGGLKAGMGYLGCADLQSLRQRAQFVRLTNAGFRESHVHDVAITKESPNYRSD